MVVHLVSPERPLRHDLPAQLRACSTSRTGWRASTASARCRSSARGDYAMRVWLDPQKVAQRGLSASDVVAAIRGQNVQAAAGVVGASPGLPGVDMQLSINAQGRLQSEEEFGDIIVKTGAERRRSRGCATSPASSWARPTTRCARCSTTSRPSPCRSSRRRAPTRSRSPTTCAHDDGRAASRTCPRASTTRSSTTRRSSCAPRSSRWSHTLLEADRAGGAGGHPVPADLARVDHPAAGGAGVDRRHLRA